MSIIQGSAMQGATRGFYPRVIEGSLRFNDDDSPYLSWTPDSAGNRKTWTWSGWVKLGNTFTTERVLFSAGSSASDTGFGQILLANDATIRINAYFQTWRGTTAKLRDPSAWYHLVVAFDTTQSTAADRVKVYINGVEQTAFDYNNNPTQNTDYAINQSATHYIGRIDAAIGTGYLDGYLADVHFIDGQAKDADDFGSFKNGVWVAEDYTGTYGTNGFLLTFEDDAEVESFNTTLHRGNGGTQSVTGTGFSPDLVWIKNRDNADNHYLYDTVRGPNRYLNSDATSAEDYSANDLNSFDSDGFTVGSDGGINRSGQAIVAWQWDAGANNASTGHSSVTYSGNQTDNTRISGLPFRPDLVWIKERDSTSSHQLYDSVRGADNGLRSDTTAAEFSLGEFGGFDKNGFIVNNSNGINQSGQTYVAWAWDAGDGDAVSNTDGSTTSTVKSNGDFAVITYSGNGASGGATIGHGLTSAPDWIIIKRRNSAADWINYHSSMGSTHGIRFTTAAKEDVEVFFKDTDPTDTVFRVGGSGEVNHASGTYVAYAWRNVTGKQKFDSYTGTGASGNTVTTGFRVGWLMIKRTDSTGSWKIFDSSRNPFEQDDHLLADTSGTEGTDSNGGVVFTSTGFTINNTGSASTNADGGEYIYAAFAGSYSDFITDYNTDGSIDSRVKANDTYGFSIVSYEGTGSNDTVGHGLSSAPDWIVVKNRDRSSNWHVWHNALNANQILELSTTAAVQTDNTFWNNTLPTSTVFSVGTGDNSINASGEDLIAYCWAEKSGYSKFGSYSGGTDGTSVTGLGFKPAIVIVKPSAGGTGSWRIYDNTRDVTNPTTKVLIANNSNAESDSSNSIDIDADGFTLNGTSTAHNGSGYTYIYAAFADTREAAFWLDQSGNDNDWQPVNLDHNDTVADSPTDNFATFNPLLKAKYSATDYRNLGTFSDGNLLLTTDADNESGTVSFGATSGKYYMEFTSENLAQRQQIIVYSTDDYRSDTGAVTTSSDGGGNATDRVSWTTGDVIGIAVDVDNSKVFIHKNGDYFGTSNPVTNTGGDTLNSFTGVGVRQDSGSTGSAKISFNAGQQPFKYGPPE